MGREVVLAGSCTGEGSRCEAREVVMAGSYDSTIGSDDVAIRTSGHTVG